MNKLLVEIKSKYSKLSKTEKRIADYLFQNTDSIHPMTITDLSKLVGVSEATILRFVKRIGCSGYSQFRFMLANHAGSHIVNASIDKGDSFIEMYSKISDDVYSTLVKTREGLSNKLLESAYEAIINADQILVVGVGNSYVMSLDLYHKLLRAGFNVRPALDSLFGFISSSQLTKRSLLICITHSGYTKDVFDCAEAAKHNGARILTITSDPSSPVAAQSDIVLRTCSNEIDYRVLGLNSRYSELLIFDTLYSYIVTHSENVENTIKSIEDNISVKLVVGHGRSASKRKK